jgi:hypothetical protein
MRIATGKQLSANLRRWTDGVRRRLWVSSPFVGGWSAVQRILGVAWRNNPTIDVRFLTDIDNRGVLDPVTIKQFESHGQIKHLRGLHAKIFIVDDRALLSSANLTRAAFAKRHETGVFFESREAQPIINLFDKWWNSKTTVIPPDGWAAKLTKSKRKPRENDEPFTAPLKTLYPLPPMPTDGRTVTFGDYAAFLTCYGELAGVYANTGPRLWTSLPLYLETDAFLNFLFHDAQGRPSKQFVRRPPRNLSDAQRLAEVSKYRAEFAKWVHNDPRAERYRRQRLSTWRTVRTVLSKRRVDFISRSDVREVVQGFHSMRAVDINPVRFLSPSNNQLRTIRKAWKDVLYPDSASLELAMRRCMQKLYGFGRSNIQELLGWHDPKRYPIRNANSNAGLRFFGYKISAS